MILPCWFIHFISFCLFTSLHCCYCFQCSCHVWCTFRHCIQICQTVKIPGVVENGSCQNKNFSISKYTHGWQFLQATCSISSKAAIISRPTHRTSFSSIELGPKSRLKQSAILVQAVLFIRSRITAVWMLWMEHNLTMKSTMTDTKNFLSSDIFLLLKLTTFTSLGKILLATLSLRSYNSFSSNEETSLFETMDTRCKN